MADSSEEDFSDEEFDLEALQCARAFLSEDETNEAKENLVPVGTDKQVTLELQPISALEELAKQAQSPTKPDYYPEELNNMTQLNERTRAKLLEIMRKRASACEKNEALTAEERPDDPNYHKNRLQIFHQRIAHLKPKVYVSCSSSSAKARPSTPTTSHNTPTAPASTILSQSREHLNINFPDEFGNNN